MIGRDGRLDARNAFATTNADERKRIFEGVLGGPVGSSGKTSFMFSGNDQTDDQQGVRVCRGADQAPSRTSCRNPSARRCSRSASRTSAATRRSSRFARATNTRPATIAASAARRSRRRARTSGITNSRSPTRSRRRCRPTLLNQFQMLFGHEREPTVSVSRSARHRRRRRVHRRRRAGRSRAHRDAHADDGEPRLVARTPDSSRQDSSCRTGAAAASTTARISAARTTFSNLDAYAAGRPYAFTQQQGNGDLAFLEKQVGAYIKDDWQGRPDLSLSFGVRYDWQNYFHDDNNFSPRASIAYAPAPASRSSSAAASASSTIAAARS